MSEIPSKGFPSIFDFMMKFEYSVKKSRPLFAGTLGIHNNLHVKLVLGRTEIPVPFSIQLFRHGRLQNFKDTLSSCAKDPGKKAVSAQRNRAMSELLGYGR